MAAMKSPLFKVAEYGLEEINYYPIKIFWNFLEAGAQPNANNEKAYIEKQTNLLFPVGATIPVTKTIKFSKKEAIELLVTYEPHVEGFSRYIAYFKTPPQNPKETEFQVIFKIKINESGVLVMEECFLQEEYTEETKVPKPKPAVTPATTPAPAADKKEGEAPAQPAQPTPPPQEEFEIKKSKKTRQTPLKYDFILVEKTTQKELETYFETECKMKNQDRIINETYERKNELESLIINSKDKLTSTYKNFVNPADVPKLLETLEKANEWLYSDGQNASRGLYLEKIDALKPSIEPIARRYHQAEQLDYAYQTAHKSIQSNISLLNSTDPKYSHITQEERSGALADCEKAIQLLANSKQLQSSIAGWENPVTSAFEVNKNVNDLSEVIVLLIQKVKKVMSKALPPPPPKEEKKETATSAAGAAGDKMDVQSPAGTTPDNGAGDKMDVEKDKTV